MADLENLEKNRKRLNNTTDPSSTPSNPSYSYDKFNEYTDISHKKTLSAETHSRNNVLYIINLLSSFKKKLHPTRTQKTCLFQIFMLMAINNCLKPQGKNYIVNALGAHILLGYYYAQYFETPIIKNHSVTAPSAQILLDDSDLQYLEPPIFKTFSVTSPSAQILLGSDSIQCQHSNRT